MSVQENIAAYKSALNAVIEHCMAAKVHHASGKVVVYYPDGYYPQGCRVDDSAKGLKQAAEIMERHWQESFY